MKYFVTHDHLCTVLKKQLDTLTSNYNLIIGVSRGGMVPAVYASYYLNIPLTCMGVKSYDKHQQTYRGEITQLPVITDPENARILVIDDVNDTGYTFKFIYDHLTKYQKVPTDKITFLSVYGKKKTTYTSFVCEWVPDDTWIVFPWDV